MAVLSGASDTPSPMLGWLRAALSRCLTAQQAASRDWPRTTTGKV